jgi:Uma2 family endonuclease
MRPADEEPGELRRFTSEEVVRMIEVGILREDEPLELVRGQLIVVPPQGPEHSTITARLADRLRALYAGRAVVREEKPLFAGTSGLPEPDVAVITGRHEDYARAHPRGVDALLVVEVAVTSQATDRAKALDYAQGAVPVLWLIDVPARRLEVHTEPQPDGRYRLVHILAGADEVALPGTDTRWRVDALFV